MFHREDLERYHAACKMIEYDGPEAYHTCCERYGNEVANLLLVMFLRARLGALDSFPTPERVVPEVNGILTKLGLIR